MATSSNGTQLAAEARTEFGKGAARRVRRDHKIPAVLYGHGEEPRHITLPGHETMLALKTPNALLDLDFGGGESTLAIAKDVQRDPVKRVIEHIDLVIVRRGERIEVQIPVHVVGEAAPETIVTLENNTITITAEATHLPESVEVDVEGLTAGHQVLAGQITLAEGTELAMDEDLIVVSVLAAPTAAQLDAELSEAEAEAGIEKDEKDEETEGDAPAASDEPTSDES
jgi:large subunit ribosomal protein L25